MKFTITRFVLVWMFFPLFFGIPAGVIGSILGCEYLGISQHPCEIFGLVDIRPTLEFFAGFVFAAPFTIITGIVLLIPIAIGKTVAFLWSLDK